MITLLVDEAYAFDYLCILEVKNGFGKTPSIEVSRCHQFLECQTNLYMKVIHSNEYLNLYHANLKIFNLLEDKKHPAGYKAIAEANRQRFLCKQALQNKFFGGEMKVEKKSGRDAQ